MYCRRGLIRLAKAGCAGPSWPVLPSQDCMREGEARPSATGRAVFRVATQATNVAGGQIHGAVGGSAEVTPRRRGHRVDIGHSRLDPNGQGAR